VTDATSHGGALEHSARVRFHQADPAGLLFFGRFFELVNDAYEDLIRAAGPAFDGLVGLKRYATPVVHAEADYYRPIRLGESVTVRLTIERIGRTSVTYDFEVVGPDGDRRAHGRVVHVLVDSATLTKLPIGEEMRQALLDVAERLHMPTPTVVRGAAESK